MLSLIFLLWAFFAQSDAIAFENPSFEDEPRASASPAGWGSHTPGSTPDILPGAWGLQLKPAEGNTCIGLVTRDDGSSEDVAQNLPAVLKGGTCYTFSVRLAHLPKYVGYNQAVRLRVWGGGTNQRSQLLASSPLINHADWREYKFEFIPDKDVRCITMDAYFGPGVLFYYKGNILIDQCSVIQRCDRA